MVNGTILSTQGAYLRCIAYLLPLPYAELCDLLIEHSEREAKNQLDGRQSENANTTPALGLSRVTVDTPIYFSLNDLLAKVRDKNVEPVGTRQGPMFSDVGLGEPKRAVTVIDLSSVPFDVRPTVAAQIGRLAFEFNYWNPKYREFPILLVCEEAHAYIPQASESQFAGSRKSMERIAKEGRKFIVGLAVVSQRPHEVSESVLAQCGTFICLRITNPDDQGYVRGLVPESEGDLVSVLAGWGRGEALVLGEAVPLPTRL